MKTKDSQKNEPNIRITIHAKEKNIRHYPSIRKTKKMLNAELKDYCKMGESVTFRVVYGKAETKQGKMEIFDNEMTTNNIQDLAWAYKAFLDKDLWLSK